MLWLRIMMPKRPARLRTEANAASDNPLVFDDGEVISGGNFHAEPVAFASDIIALAVAEVLGAAVVRVPKVRRHRPGGSGPDVRDRCPDRLQSTVGASPVS